MFWDSRHFHPEDTQWLSLEHSHQELIPPVITRGSKSAGTRSPRWHCGLAARRALVPGQVREPVLHDSATTGEQAEGQVRFSFHYI